MNQAPNILWITTDQQRADTIRALGNPHIHTSHLDQLCAEGIAFTNVYCQSPICTPSRASFLTGLYPSRLPCNINGNARCHLPAGVKLITRRLADVGYDCGLAGKLHIASAWNGVEERVDDGYRRFCYSHAPVQGVGRGNQYIDWLASIGALDQVLDYSHWNEAQQTGARQRENVPFELHQTTWCCDRAIEFMNEPRRGPWLMTVNIFDPHSPYDAPAEFARRYDPASLPPPPFRDSDLALQERISRTHLFPMTPHHPGPSEQRNLASYYGMIELIDRNVGRLLAELERTGQRENTVVIFTSDHGNLMGDHGLTEKGCRFYEGLVRVPLIISWPGRFRAGHIENGLVELTDLAPTLAALGGAKEARSDGQSLLPALTGQGCIERDFVRCEFYDTLDMNFGQPDRPPHRESYATMARDSRHKLVVYHGTDFGELYDLERDPKEFDNLWGDPAHGEVCARLSALLEATAPVTRDPAERIGRF